MSADPKKSIITPESNINNVLDSVHFAIPDEGPPYPSDDIELR